MIEVLQIAIKAIKANKLRATLVIIALILIVVGLALLAKHFHEELTVEKIESLVRRYGYYLIFALVMLGNMGVPVPEESPVIISGFFAQKGLFDYKIALLVCF